MFQDEIYSVMQNMISSFLFKVNFVLTANNELNKDKDLELISDFILI
jgi:hypothetical protein